MVSNGKKIFKAVIGGVITCLLWAAYVLLLFVLVPGLPIKAKVAIAIAFVIPTVVVIGAVVEKIKK